MIQKQILNLRLNELKISIDKNTELRQNIKSLKDEILELNSSLSDLQHEEYIELANEMKDLKSELHILKNKEKELKQLENRFNKLLSENNDLTSKVAHLKTKIFDESDIIERIVNEIINNNNIDEFEEHISIIENGTAYSSFSDSEIFSLITSKGLARFSHESSTYELTPRGEKVRDFLIIKSN